jgi:hypothetical protein
MLAMAIMMIATVVIYVEKKIGTNMTELRVSPAITFDTKEEAQAFIRSIMGPRYTELQGVEYNHVTLILALLEPYQQTNNQRSWTDYYKVGNIEYRVTTWPGEHPTIAEYLPEET